MVARKIQKRYASAIVYQVTVSYKGYSKLFMIGSLSATEPSENLQAWSIELISVPSRIYCSLLELIFLIAETPGPTPWSTCLSNPNYRNAPKLCTTKIVAPLSSGCDRASLYLHDVSAGQDIPWPGKTPVLHAIVNVVPIVPIVQ